MLDVISTCGNWSVIFVALCRFRRLDTSYRFFFAYMIVGVGLETSTYFVGDLTTRNILQDNYSLISTLLILIVMNMWRRKKQRPYLFIAIISGIIAIMLFDFLSRPMDKPKIPWGFMICGFIIIMEAIRSLSEELTFGVGPWYRQSRILILLPLIIIYLYFIMLMLIISVLYDDSSAPILQGMFKLMNVLNLFKYLLFILALVWIPRKERFL